LRLIEEAGVEGYDMKAKILKSFDDIQATQARIGREKAADAANGIEAKNNKGKK
jgi:hypothetical protein